LYPETPSPVRRALLGGLTFILVKGVLKVYHKQHQYIRQSRRVIGNFDPNNAITTPVSEWVVCTERTLDNNVSILTRHYNVCIIKYKVRVVKISILKEFAWIKDQNIPGFLFRKFPDFFQKGQGRFKWDLHTKWLISKTWFGLYSLY
jgi:hypothetical protein